MKSDRKGRFLLDLKGVFIFGIINKKYYFYVTFCCYLLFYMILFVYENLKFILIILIHSITLIALNITFFN